MSGVQVYLGDYTSSFIMPSKPTNKMVVQNNLTLLNTLSQLLKLGFVPGLFGTSHGALQFMAYEELKKEYSFYKNVAVDVKLNPLEYVTMAALSKVFAVTATYPYQVVRARLQDQHTQYSGVMNAIGRTWRNEGVHGFYKGVVPNVLKVTPACCITFLVYENVSQFLLSFRQS
ncbi:mitochondrial folate transporter/carrier isoform X2 [Rhincodon typus]|uniref:mitochondrial folate transporter/carrier isoform X2 n=1 Tax=Rhincodon typus TaxID=259920 RepID=UPI00202F8710|nr:mitochondrial folate transporter/carrier isoform X2 [Rhincodon typus]